MLVWRSLSLSAPTSAGLGCSAIGRTEPVDVPGLFVERSDFMTTDHALRLAEQVDSGLRQQNIEYAGKRRSQRLGPVRMELMAPGTWGEWDHRQLMHTGGPEAKYKHPCLITDLYFREKVSVELELAPSDLLSK
jgi:hypothetical protein